MLKFDDVSLQICGTPVGVRIEVPCNTRVTLSINGVYVSIYSFHKCLLCLANVLLATTGAAEAVD